MNYLTFEHVSKSFGDKVLFWDMNFVINKGDKIALIARNGAGKTTLLRIIDGTEAPEGENARIITARNIKIEYLEQEPEISDSLTVRDYVLSSDKEQVRVLNEYLDATVLGDAERLQKATIAMDNTKAWDLEARIHELFNKLKIKDLDQTIATLSGGQKKRVALGKVLLDPPDFLILDEPTNHLDVEMIEWLELYLSRPNLTVLMVTHDRYFLDRVCTQIFEIYRSNLYKYRGNYSQYLEKKAMLQENEATQLDKTKKLLRKELEWIRRMPKARGTKAKSRISRFEQIKERAAQKLYEDPMQINVAMQRLGSKILELRHVYKSFDDLKILDGFEYKFQKGERVGIIGPNGVGKSTFLRILTRELRPDHGTVIHGDTLHIGFYTQEYLRLKKDLRVIDVVRNVAEYLPLESGHKLSAEQLLERFMFPRPQQQVFYSQLSGGERRRLFLLTILMRNPNFLILDEPTNDLDILTLNVLEDFLLAFPGVVVIASHDRYMLDKLADHLLVFHGQGKITDFPGNYTNYLNSGGRIPATTLKKAPTGEDQRQESSGKQQYEDRKKIKRLEKEIEKLEQEKSAIHASFEEATTSLEDLQNLSRRLKEVEALMQTKETQWMEMVEQI